MITIQDFQVYNVIKSAKKPRSCSVPGDIPKKLIQEFIIDSYVPYAADPITTKPRDGLRKSSFDMILLLPKLKRFF